jgi:hypothetical protein
VHNFKIIDSEADEELGNKQLHLHTSSNKNLSSEPQEQFDELIDRFQKIKSKSKHLS